MRKVVVTPPPPPMTRLVNNALQGLPVTATASGLHVGGQCSQDDLLEAGRRLVHMAGEAVTFLNFVKGDWFDALPTTTYGQKADIVKNLLGEGHYKQLKACSRVSRKWDASRRDMSLPWRFYKTTACLSATEQDDYLKLFKAKQISIEGIEQKKGSTVISHKHKMNLLLLQLRDMCRSDAEFVNLLRQKLHEVQSGNGIP